MELQDLLSLAREANARYDVTGMLLYLPESFIQLIEGPENHIEQLYQNIQKDQRHFRVTTLREGIIEKRFYPNWSMAFNKQHTADTGDEILSPQDGKVLQLFDILER